MQNEVIVAAIIAAILSSVAVLFYAFFTWDRLVQYQYAHHRPLWEADGKPGPFLFWPFETPVPFARWNTAHIRWLFATPSWAASNPEVRRLISRWRMAVLVWNIAYPVAFAAAMWQAFR